MIQIHIRFKENVFLWIKKQAKKQNRSISNFINHFFEELSKKDKKET